MAKKIFTEKLHVSREDIESIVLSIPDFSLKVQAWFGMMTAEK